MLTLALMSAIALAANPKTPTAAEVVKKPMVLGIAQPYGDEPAKKAKTLIEPYLSKTLGSEVTVQIFPNTEDLSAALADGKVQMAWITPLAFVRANQKNSDVIGLMKAVRQGGGLTYRAAFIVKKDSPLKALADLKGKKVAWVSKSSTSGYLFAKELIRAAGENPDTFFSSENFAGDHPSVCRAVRSGTADVGATFAAEPAPNKPLVPNGCEDAGPVSDFTVVASSKDLPNEVIAAGPSFDLRRQNEVTVAFAKMSKNDDGKTVLKDGFRVEAWAIAVDGDFIPVAELLKPKAAAAPAPAPEPKENKTPKKGK
jgi:phosphonate transport system substrate-binding protein